MQSLYLWKRDSEKNIFCFFQKRFSAWINNNKDLFSCKDIFLFKFGRSVCLFFSKLEASSLNMKITTAQITGRLSQAK